MKILKISKFGFAIFYIEGENDVALLGLEIDCVYIIIYFLFLTVMIKRY
jgi:hypothetical protein